MRKCVYCAKELIKRQKRFCSRECYWAWMKGKPTWNIGLTKESDSRVAKQNTRNGHSWNYGLKKGLDPRMEKFGKRKPLLEKKCITCGKIMFLKPCEFNERKYCQMSCKPSWNINLTKEIDERLAKQSRKMKQQYLEGVRDIAVLLGGLKRKPTKDELILDIILQRFYPDKWRYVGNGKIWLTSCGKHMNPDFVDNNGNKKAVEYNSSYWHKNDNEDDRVSLYRKIGWECLIITEEDLFKNQSMLIRKLKDYNIS